jgi:hypothetical protein
MSDDEILKEMRVLFSKCSIEGLSMDGEASLVVQNSLRRMGIKRWNQLVRMLGRKPTMGEIYGEIVGPELQTTECRPEGF